MFQEVFLCYINAFNSIQWYSNLIHRLHLSGKVPTPFSGVCTVSPQKCYSKYSRDMVHRNLFCGHGVYLTGEFKSNILFLWDKNKTNSSNNVTENLLVSKNPRSFQGVLGVLNTFRLTDLVTKLNLEKLLHLKNKIFDIFSTKITKRTQFQHIASICRILI